MHYLMAIGISGSNGGIGSNVKQAADTLKELIKKKLLAARQRVRIFFAIGVSGSNGGLGTEIKKISKPLQELIENALSPVRNEQQKEVTNA